jgi:D-mannonate dehydratase
MTQYTWTITNLYTQTIDGKKDYVVNAIYDVVGTDGTYTASMTSNTAQFSTEDVTEFTPYADLTEAIVINWVKESLGENGIISIEACIQGQIDSEINPPVTPQETPLPWN